MIKEYVILRFVNAKKGLMIGAKLIFPQILRRMNNGFCTDSNSYFGAMFGVSPQAVSKWIEELGRQKIIKIAYTGKAGKVVRKLSSIVDSTYQASLIELSSMLDECNSITYSNTYIVEQTAAAPVVESKKQKIGIGVIQEIVEYLNSHSGREFQAQTKSTQDKIKARVKEGYLVEDFKKVILVKCADWRNDKKMKKFLRPETLFGTKFESYLNEAKEAGTKTPEELHKENDTPTAHDDRYQKYLDWAKVKSPNVMQAVKHLSKSQFIQFLNGEFMLKSRARLTTVENDLSHLRRAHVSMERDNELFHKYANVLDCFNDQVREHIAALERI